MDQGCRASRRRHGIGCHGGADVCGGIGGGGGGLCPLDRRVSNLPLGVATQLVRDTLRILRDAHPPRDVEGVAARGGATVLRARLSLHVDPDELNVVEPPGRQHGGGVGWRTLGAQQSAALAALGRPRGDPPPLSGPGAAQEIVRGSPEQACGLQGAGGARTGRTGCCEQRPFDHAGPLVERREVLLKVGL